MRNVSGYFMKTVAHILFGLCLIAFCNESCVNNNFKQAKSIVGSTRVVESINDSIFSEFKKCSVKLDIIEMIWKGEVNMTIRKGEDSGCIQTIIKVLGFSNDRNRIMQLVDSFPPIKSISPDSTPHFPRLIGDQYLYFKCKNDTLLRFKWLWNRSPTGGCFISINKLYYHTDFDELNKMLKKIKTTANN